MNRLLNSGGKLRKMEVEQFDIRFTLEEKISIAEAGVIFSSIEGDSHGEAKSVRGVIRLMTEKIKKKHCE